MSESTEGLRRLLRDAQTQLKSKASPSSASARPNIPADRPRDGSPPSTLFAVELPVRGSVGLWALWVCAGLCLLGAILSWKWLSVLGAVGTLAALPRALLWGAGKDRRGLQDLTRRVAALEAQLQTLHVEAGVGGASRELVEEVQQLQTMVRLLFQALGR